MELQKTVGRVKLTAGRVRDFSCKAGRSQSFLWDTEAVGLAVRVTASGTKAYIFQGKLAGQTIRMTIGDVRTWTIEADDSNQNGAREEARRLQAFIDQKIDPRRVKAEQIAAAKGKRADQDAQHAEATRRLITVAEAWSAYLEARRSKWSARHFADHMAIADIGGRKTKIGEGVIEPGALAVLMPLKLAEIDAARVKTWLCDEAVRRPTQAALAFRLLRAFLNWCSDTPRYSGIASAEACQPRVAKDALPKRSTKTDCLQREQLPAWFSAVRSISNPVIAAYLQILLLTGSRREELAGAKWGDVDFKWNSLTIRDKVEGERTIPLTPYVSSLLKDLSRRNEWVFSSPAAASGRLAEPRIQHNRALTVAGLPHLTLHGLRRSFSTLAEWVECPAGVVAQIMGHKPSATAEKHYKVRALDLLRMWHTRIEEWMLEQADISHAPTADIGLKPSMAETFLMNSDAVKNNRARETQQLKTEVSAPDHAKPRTSMAEAFLSTDFSNARRRKRLGLT